MSLGTFRDALVLFVAPRGSSPGRLLPRVVVRSTTPPSPPLAPLRPLPPLLTPAPPPRLSDFSETYKRTGPPPAYSPDGLLLATAVDHRLVVRDAESLAVVSMSDCCDKIQHLQWSRDSDHVLAAMHARGVVQCFSVSDDSWTCTIDEGPAGIARALWSPAGTEVLIVADFAVRVSAWSLVDGSCRHLRAPKFPDRGLDFSADGRFLAVLERREGRDQVCVIDCETWTSASRFVLDPGAVKDAADVSWSPDATTLAIRDGATNHAVCLYAPDGRLLHAMRPKDAKAQGMGVKTLAWSPGGALLATGGFDGKARLLNHLTWRAFAELHHPERVVAPATAAVYEETEEVEGSEGLTDGEGSGGRKESVLSGSLSGQPSANTVGQAATGETSWWEDVWDGEDGTGKDVVARSRAMGMGNRSKTRARYVVRPLPALLPTPSRREALDAAAKGAPLERGVGRIAWSPDDRFVATAPEATPRAVWVWDATTCEPCAVLAQMEPVRAFEWDPAHPARLALVCGTNRAYVWTPEGASFVQIPIPGFEAKTLAWNPKGGAFALGDKGTFCCAFID